MTKKELFIKIGIHPPKGVLMYGPPGTGKTLLARAVASQTQATFLRLSGTLLNQVGLGDGAKMVQNAFELAKQKAPAIIFIDELDAIGTKRFDASDTGDRDIQRTMLELLNQLDGFQPNDDIKVIAATNRVDVLDPALLRSGRFDRKIEFPAPNEKGREQILRIHSRRMNVDKNVNFVELSRCIEDFNGAQCRAVCVEAGMVALRRDSTKILHEDFMDGILEGRFLGNIFSFYSIFLITDQFIWNSQCFSPFLAFSNASSRANFIIVILRLRNSVVPFDLTNELTEERLTLKSANNDEEDFLLIRCPISRNENQWTKWEKDKRDGFAHEIVTIFPAFLCRALPCFPLLMSASLARQLVELQTNPTDGFAVRGLVDDNIFKWQVTSLRRRHFLAQLDFPISYPQHPPKMRFITNILHPNGNHQSLQGWLCVHQYSPSAGRRTTWRREGCITLAACAHGGVYRHLSQIHAVEPNFLSPANLEALLMFRINPQRYNERVKQCVKESNVALESDYRDIPTNDGQGRRAQ
ncbi:hypothetical protein niasHT_018126 [Heterodera trifolii]